MVKVSIDFDGTLGHRPHIQQLAKELCMDGHNEVYIITRRYAPGRSKDDEHTDVYRFAHALGIPQYRVHFLNRDYKAATIHRLGIQVHWDDDPMEIAMIRENCPGCIAFLCA